MSDLSYERCRRRASLYAEFVERVDRIALNIQRSAHNGDTANVLVDVDRIKGLIVGLDIALDYVSTLPISATAPQAG